MKANIRTDSEGVITGVVIRPFDESEPYVEIDSLSDISVGRDRFIHGEIVKAENDTSSERAEIRYQIDERKRYLNETDYYLFKVMDGAMTEDEYSEVKKKRQEARDEINELEEKLISLING